jgi:hypothetical protein
MFGRIEALPEVIAHLVLGGSSPVSMETCEGSVIGQMRIRLLEQHPRRARSASMLGVAPFV